MSSEKIPFDDFELDLGRYELRRRDRVVKLEKNPMELLILLVEKQGLLVTREEIIERLWGDNVFVDTRHGINTAVHKLRVALRDDSECPRILETVMGKGYRLASRVATASISQRNSFRRSDQRDPSAAEVKEAQPSRNRSKSPSAVITGTTRGPASSIIFRVRNRKLLFSSVMAGLVSVAIAAFLTLGDIRDLPFRHFAIAKMIDAGNVDIALISPDGKYVVDVVSEGGKSSLWMRHVATNSKTQIMPAANSDYAGLSFSPDGNHLVFTRSEADNPNTNDLFRVPAFGGNPQLLVRDVTNDATFSPDGERIAFCRYLPATNEIALMTASAEGGQEKKLITVQRPVAIRPSPAWSPDGKTIVLNVQDPKDEFNGPLMAVDSSTGRQVWGLNVGRIFQDPKWLPDGTGLLVLEQDKSISPRHQIGIVSYPSAKFRQITNDVNDYRSLSVSKDGNLLAAVVFQSRANINITSTTDITETPEGQLASPVNNLWWNFAWMKDGSLLIQQFPRLLILPPGETAPVDFKDIAYGPPDACTDGRYIVYLGKVGISRMEANGNNAIQITSGVNDFGPVCSRDGKWVFYVDTTEGHQKIMRVSLEGGQPEQFSKLTPTDIWLDLSLDGKWLVADVSTSNLQRLAIVSVDSGEVIRMVEPNNRYYGQPRFTPDRLYVAYQVREDSGVAVWAQSITDLAGKFVVPPQPDAIGNFHWSLDGQKFALSRIHRERDVALIRNQR